MTRSGRFINEDIGTRGEGEEKKFLSATFVGDFFLFFADNFLFFAK